MSCTKYTGMPRSTLARHTGAAVIHQVATLIASSLGERLDELLVVLEAVHGRAQREPVGRLAERVQRDLVAAVEQPVEVLEDVAVPAADAGVLGHVGDPQPAFGRPHVRARRRSRASAPRTAAGTRARARPRSVPRVTDSWWTSRAAGK